MSGYMLPHGYAKGQMAESRRMEIRSRSDDYQNFPISRPGSRLNLGARAVGFAVALALAGGFAAAVIL